MADRQAHPSAHQQRSRARHYAVQGLYQWLLTEVTAQEIVDQFLDEYDFTRADTEYFRELLSRVIAARDDLQREFESLLDRPLDQVDPVEKAILLVGAYELKARPDVPYRVVLDEAITLAKRFGGDESHKYINGVLDQLAHRLRAGEK